MFYFVPVVWDVVQSCLILNVNVKEQCLRCLSHNKIMLLFKKMQHVYNASHSVNKVCAIVFYSPAE